MQTITKTFDVFKFDELSEEAKSNVLSKQYDINVHDNWWAFTYEDAEGINVKINEFDIDRASYVRIELQGSVREVCKMILENHGLECATYKLAEKTLARITGWEEIEDTKKSIIEEFEKYCLKNGFDYYVGRCPKQSYFSIIEELEEEDKIRLFFEDLYDRYITEVVDKREEAEELEDEFKEELENCYLSILRCEYEYLTSEEAIIESVKSNDYDFTEDGEIY